MGKFLFILVVFICALGINGADAQFKREYVVSKDTMNESLNMPKEKLSSLFNREGKHSPHRATIYSLIFPGLGQIYNRQYWKLPILYGGFAATIYGIDWNSGMYSQYRNAFTDYVAYTNFVNDENKAADAKYDGSTRWKEVYPRDVTEFDKSNQDWLRTILKNKKDSYKRDRDLTYIVFVGVYLLNVLDATVFAHFYDFDISDDLSMGIVPTLGYDSYSGNKIGLNCVVRF